MAEPSRNTAVWYSSRSETIPGHRSFYDISVGLFFWKREYGPRVYDAKYRTICPLDGLRLKWGFRKVVGECRNAHFQMDFEFSE